jgi:hypothetical protein
MPVGITLHVETAENKLHTCRIPKGAIKSFDGGKWVFPRKIRLHGKTEDNQKSIFI